MRSKYVTAKACDLCFSWVCSTEHPPGYVLARHECCQGPTTQAHAYGCRTAQRELLSPYNPGGDDDEHQAILTFLGVIYPELKDVDAYVRLMASEGAARIRLCRLARVRRRYWFNKTYVYPLPKDTRQTWWNVLACMQETQEAIVHA